MTGTSKKIVSAIDGSQECGTWNLSGAIFPLPRDEILLPPNLGYNVCFYHFRFSNPHISVAFSFGFV
jgi:hypothetical protein